jgi:hypothetical protein
VVIISEEDWQPQNKTDNHEDGVDVPLDRIKPEILKTLIAEFVTREWEEPGDSKHRSIRKFVTEKVAPEAIETLIK